MVYWIEAVFEGNVKKWKFSYEQLEDCLNDKRVRRELENAIAFFVPSGGSETQGSKGPQPDIPPTELAATPMHARVLRVFLCHSRFDKPAVRKLHHELSRESIHLGLTKRTSCPERTGN
jgi:hypothetical protein